MVLEGRVATGVRLAAFLMVAARLQAEAVMHRVAEGAFDADDGLGEFTHPAKATVAFDQGLGVGGVGELAIRIALATVVAQIEALTSTGPSRHRATPSTAGAIRMQKAGVAAACAGVIIDPIAVVASLKSDRAVTQVGAPHPITATRRGANVQAGV
jgi:hypothetical protein